MKRTKTKELILRIPRPQSFTLMCQSYQKGNLNLNTLRNITIQHFLSSNLTTLERISHPTRNTKRNNSTNTKTITYRLKNYDIKDLGHTLMLTLDKAESKVTKHLTKSAEKMRRDGLFIDDVGISRAVKSRLFFGALSRLQDLSDWETELRQASRAYYHKPGYSMAANSAITTTNNHMAHLMKLTESLEPKALPSLPHSGHNINIQNNVALGLSQAPEGQETLTADKAIALLAEAKVTALPLDNKDEFFAGLLDKHNLNSPDIPEVAANLSDAQGVTRAKTFDFEKPIPIDHITRREDEVGQSTDAIES